ncbi:hypothetical protein NVP1121O_107 [Vibrio phage 1.121.O._10N.286.46.C4]|nr:hypothetical protein NVP1121O_107 [Vibrio phage 1.121.O._10N.286.46.C4]
MIQFKDSTHLQISSLTSFMSNYGGYVLPFGKKLTYGFVKVDSKGIPVKPYQHIKLKDAIMLHNNPAYYKDTGKLLFSNTTLNIENYKKAEKAKLVDQIYLQPSKKSRQTGVKVSKHQVKVLPYAFDYVAGWLDDEPNFNWIMEFAKDA